MATRIYSYGAKRPTQGIESIMEQLRLAHKYRNKLCEIELNRRKASDDAIRAASPRLVEIESQLESIDAQIKSKLDEISAENAKSRSKTASKPQRDEVARLRTERKSLYTERKAIRAEMFADGSPVKAKLKEIDDAASAALREARGACGVFWGTYSITEAAAESFRKGAPPRFMRWDGCGRIAVQIQATKPMVTDEIYGDDTRLRIVPRATGKWSDVWLRIGSNEDRTPIWSLTPVKMHRPLPPGAQIKWAWLLRRTIGPREEWRLQITVKADSFNSDREIATTGACGIDLGWRLLPDRLRIAVWVNEDGTVGEHSIPIKETGRWEKANDLRSIRDKAFDGLKLHLCDWLDQNTIPDWLKEATKALHQWRSPARLRGVIERWRGERFDGDTEIFIRCEEWRKQDKHLHLWEASQITKAARWRDNLHRNLVEAIRAKYATVHVENTNWKDVTRRPDAAASSNDDHARKYFRLASVGRLVQLLKESVNVIPVEAAFTTQRCNACDTIEEFDAMKSVIHKCSNCGVEWDQDENAARNILDIGTGRKTPVTSADLRKKSA